MRRLVASGATDAGRVRDGNEDALLIRDSIFAVADGMGGHVAGEVASAKALEPIESLDGRVFGDDDSASSALHDAVVEANRHVADLARQDPAYRGMGTTLTAALLEGRRLHLAHVGDSRAYLFRDGHLSQITDDHTLVQHLIDEGQITREEAENHPQRSIVTRAIGVSPEIEVDAMSLDLHTGDQLLLCSDGLTGVVSDEEIASVLTSEPDGDRAVEQLITRANEAGGPDNITALLLRFEDGQAPAAVPGEEPSHQTIIIRTRVDHEDDQWAQRLGSYGPRDGQPRAEEDERRAGRVLGRAAGIVLSLTVIVVLVVGGGQFLLSRSYFVGVDGDQVVIFQGINAEVASVSLARVRERSDVTLDDVPEWYRPTLETGRPAADLTDARRIVRGIPRRAEELEDDQDGADEGQAMGSRSAAHRALRHAAGGEPRAPWSPGRTA